MGCRGLGALVGWGLALAALAWTAAPLSDHPDTLRDWYAGRDCAERGLCALAGSATSFQQLQNGTLFPNALAACAALGLDLPWAWWAVIAATAGACVAVWLAAQWLAWPGAGMAAGLVATLWATCLHAQVLWAPAFAPVLGCAAGLWALAGPGRDGLGVGWSMGLGLCGGLLIDCHPLAAAAWAGWWLALAVRGAVVASTLRLAAAACTATATAWALAPVAFEDNAAIAVAAAQTNPLAALAAAAAGAALIVVLRRMANRDRAVLCAAAIVPLAAALAGHLATGHELHPRYLAAAAPALAWLLAAVWPWSRRLADAVAIGATGLIVLVGLGRGRVSEGHGWAQGSAAATIARANGLAWPAAIGQVQGFGCRKLAAALGGTLPWRDPAAEPPGRALQVVDLPAATTLPPPWSELPAAAGSPLRTWAQVAPIWLHAGQGRICLRQQATAERCEPMRPGIVWGPQGAPAVSRQAPLHARAYPRLTTLRPPDGRASETAIELPFSSPGGARLLRILDLPDQRCPWRITDASGCTATAQSAQVVRLSCTQATTGTLRVVRAWGDGCDATTQWTDGPPCLLEAGPGDAQWLAEVAIP